MAALPGPAEQLADQAQDEQERQEIQAWGLQAVS